MPAKERSHRRRGSGRLQEDAELLFVDPSRAKRSFAIRTAVSSEGRSDDATIQANKQSTTTGVTSLRTTARNEPSYMQWYVARYS